MNFTGSAPASGEARARQSRRGGPCSTRGGKDLGASDVREGLRDIGVHGFTTLEEADDVVDAGARAFDYGVNAA